MNKKPSKGRVTARESVAVRSKTSRKLEKEKCESCLIAVPGVEEQRLFKYRGHSICFYCIDLWRSKEKGVGRRISWEKLKKGGVLK